MLDSLFGFLFCGFLSFSILFVFCLCVICLVMIGSLDCQFVIDSSVSYRNRISKKNRQHNGQKKKYNRTNNDLQIIHIKLKIEYHEYLNKMVNKYVSYHVTFIHCVTEGESFITIIYHH